MRRSGELFTDRLIANLPLTGPENYVKTRSLCDEIMT